MMQSTAYTEQELTKAFDKAKIGLMGHQRSTFLASILFRLNQSWDRSFPTAAVDGINLWINPDWFMGLTPEQRIGLLAHESWHVAFQHMLRGIDLVHRIFGIAADYVINNQLDNEGYHLPPHGYMDHQYDDMLTEDVYHAIFEEFEDKDLDYDVDIQFGDDLSDKEQEQLDQKVQNILIQAKIQSEAVGEKLQGHIPGDILRKLDELLNPKLPWNHILQNYVNAFAAQDYSFRRPDPRFQPDWYLATLDGNTIDHICVAIDSSGSVTDPEFVAFLTEVQNIKDFTKPNKLTIIDFDHNIKDIHELTEFDSVGHIEFKGYGGTNLFPPFEKAKEIYPDLFIVFTDLECEAVKEAPPFPVIWVAVNNEKTKVHFGQRVDLSTKELTNG